MSDDQFISKQAAMDLANELQISVEGYHLYNQAINNYCAEIGSLPEAIVRCKDCEHFSTELERSDGTKCSWEWCCVRVVPVTSEDFCSMAERRIDGKVN